MRFSKLWLPVIAWAALIFYFSSIPSLEPISAYDFLLIKIAHIAEYVILTFLLHRAFTGSFHANFVHSFIYPAGLSLLYAVSDEFHQTFVPGRNGCITDILIDLLGILIFYLAAKFWYPD